MENGYPSEQPPIFWIFLETDTYFSTLIVAGIHFSGGQLPGFGFDTVTLAVPCPVPAPHAPVTLWMV